MKEHVMKILIVGNAKVGKTSFVHRYISGQFSSAYKTTVGEFRVKVLQWSDKETVRLHIWDIAGQERFTSMTRVYYKAALGCVLMFDVTDSSSFLRCHQWKQDLDTKATLPGGAPIPCILLANKCDLPERVVTADSIAEFSKNNGFFTWMETSVRDNRNVDEAMRRLVQEILSVQPSEDQLLSSQEDSVDLQSHDATKRQSCC
ncbi:ras-related protein Rab-7L1-like isoform X2 [Salarias fasciatus]|uniref:ras-related protein Rab-7L1-like isoform X2 n=1 Tax=Salarias fasciatus TaxID=181472 RepID=UPI0011766C24|nr:ras-related protein Rab-7L1-like isoform X2 [Salarias fasciatus]